MRHTAARSTLRFLRLKTLAAAVIAVVLVLLAFGRVGARQESAPPTPPGQQAPPQPLPPRFRTEANYVRVDVYPTIDGRAVQDLRVEDFEVFENGTRQRIEAFEHVVISPAGPQSLRVEAGSVREGERMAANPRNRVFVIFLDVPHVTVEGSHAIKEPLVRLMDRILGPDDLIAVMTPEMAASQITFGRKTQVIADMLRENWIWGHRERVAPMDRREIEYEGCYPTQAQERVVAEMVARRRERMVLDAVRDLVTYLGGVREERKAILTITTGWILFRPNEHLTDLRTLGPRTTEPVPGLDPIGVDEHGKLRVGGDRRRDGHDVSQTGCDRDRMHLAAIDNEDYFRQILDLANRANASFYPIDPRGLAAFDSSMGPAAPPLITVDQASLRTRIETLRTLADNTDGMAVVNTNDLDRGLQRIADDLTSYYLLGYYSTNTKLDGSFRRITVRVSRPGVSVRARRGYRAATAEEVSASRAASEAPIPDGVRTAGAALARLDRIRDDRRFALHAAPVRGDANGPVRAVWIAGELLPPLGEFGRGATVALEVPGAASGATVPLKPGERAFVLKVPVEALESAGDIRARVTSPHAAEPLTGSARLEPALAQPLLFRRGPSTGNRVQPAADFRFSRTERLRIELPVATDAVVGTGRLLDRNARPLPPPVQIADRTDADGQRWLTADAVLAALGPGDYVVELTFTAAREDQTVLVPIRVTR